MERTIDGLEFESEEELHGYVEGIVANVADDVLDEELTANSEETEELDLSGVSSGILTANSNSGTVGEGIQVSGPVIGRNDESRLDEATRETPPSPILTGNDREESVDVDLEGVSSGVLD
jgi:hypothetical protein